MPEFDCGREVVLPTGPQPVWDAVSTTEGTAGWLFPTPIDAGAARVWDPPHHLAVRQEQGEWFNALDFAIEDRGDGTSTLRYGHRGVFPPEDFERQNDGIQQHTDFYLHTLAEYLAHFAERPATYIGAGPGGIQAPDSSATPEGFAHLQRALGLHGRVAEADPVALAPAGVEPLDGVVDYLRPHFMGIRTAGALYRFFGRNAFGAPVGMTIHAFDGRDAETAQHGWQRFLDATFA